ncbi:hypothetical protein GRI42_05275 [Erythrobacter gaetbuli]|uniref:Uncharacterized protein n=1 Tax=Qipengyuania gaetbuli TaxID=266952 RepID=A0A844XXH2_9SPHN|nr:hypothetical protein [Qipengyuania gaetbuli]MXO50715.1 hypothetical protein [Qipengyuania gaetbuli]
MPVHFAAARCTLRSHVARVLGPLKPGAAANDNAGPAATPFVFDEALRETLMHFARHGLAAVSEARKLAERAHNDGDDDAFARWNGIFRTLDQRQASAFERQLILDNQPLIG